MNEGLMDKDLISSVYTTAIDEEHVIIYKTHVNIYTKYMHYSNYSYFTQLYHLTTCLCNPYDDGFAFLLPVQPS